VRMIRNSHVCGTGVGVQCAYLIAMYLPTREEEDGTQDKITKEIQ
jgi:hypothetical protein